MQMEIYVASMNANGALRQARNVSPLPARVSCCRRGTARCGRQWEIHKALTTSNAQKFKTVILHLNNYTYAYTHVQICAPYTYTRIMPACVFIFNSIYSSGSSCPSFDASVCGTRRPTPTRRRTRRAALRPCRGMRRAARHYEAARS